MADRRRVGRALLLVTALLLVSCGKATDDAASVNPSGGGGGAPTTVPTATSPRSGTSAPAGSGTSTTTAAPIPPYNPGPVSWRACKPDGYECTTVQVPLDYRRPDGTKIGIAVKRLPATDKAHRIGSVFVNPGGPGASGLQALPNLATDFSADVRARFDIVSWDPRGVGGSVPLTCDRGGLDFFAEDLGVANPPPSVDEKAKKWGQLCEQQNGPLLPFVGTTDIALDLESLRQAVGDDKLTYAGYSYGTLIGLVYGELFPTHLRGMILDGVVDPSLDAHDSIVSQSKAVEEALNKFIDWCPTAGDKCAVAPNAGAAMDKLFKLTHDNPLPGTVQDNTIYLSPTLIYFAIITATYNSAVWPQLATAIKAGLDGDGGPLGDLTSAYLGSASPPLNLAVNCLDSVTPTGAEFQKIVDDTIAAAPRTGAYNANSGRPCEFWPVPPKPIPTDYHLTGAPTTMIWGTTGDNATPYQNAVHVSKMLDKAELVTLDANRHAALGANDCVVKLQSDYLLNQTLPPPNTTC
jgi:pimeloyl-ACP methyl ester carboxylesterase